MCRIGYVIRDDCLTMDLATQSMFACANIVAGEPFFFCRRWGSAFASARSRPAVMPAHVQIGPSTM
jgi:hypothetical protein